MKSIAKELRELRELIVIDCTVNGQLLGIEQQQWLKRIDNIQLGVGTLLNNVALANVRQQSELLTDFMEMIESTEMVFFNKAALLKKFKNRQ